MLIGSTAVPRFDVHLIEQRWQWLLVNLTKKAFWLKRSKISLCLNLMAITVEFVLGKAKRLLSEANQYMASWERYAVDGPVKSPDGIIRWNSAPCNNTTL